MGVRRVECKAVRVEINADLIVDFIVGKKENWKKRKNEKKVFLERIESQPR